MINLQLNPTKILKIPICLFFLKKKIIKLFNDSGLSIFTNSIKFLRTPKFKQFFSFFFPKKNERYFKNFGRI
jgi:hypothetical protein